MSIWRRLFGREPKIETETKASAAGSIISAWQVGNPVWTSRNYEALADEGYVRNAIAYRCVKLIASGAASPRWLLQGRGGKEIEEHAILDLLSRPGPMIGGASLFEAFYAYILLSGNGYMEAVGPDNKPPKELWTLRPDRTKVVPGQYGLPQAYEYEANGRKMRWQVDPLTGKGAILHVKEFHPINDWYGLSRVEPSAYGIDRHNGASAHNKALLDNGARPSGALIFKPVKNGDGQHQFAPEGAIAAAEKELKNRHGGIDNAGRPMVLGGNVEWEEMGLSPRDMDFGASKDDAARDICTSFGVPHILIVPGSSTFNNVREAKLELWEDTILPLIDRVVDSLNAWLPPMFGDDLKLAIDLDDIPALEPRRETKRASVVTLLDKGVIDADEAREALQFGPRPDGSIQKIDAAVLNALVQSVEKSGYEPLFRYLLSVGLLPSGTTLEQFIEDTAASFDSDEDMVAALAPPDKNADENVDEVDDNPLE